MPRLRGVWAAAGAAAVVVAATAAVAPAASAARAAGADAPSVRIEAVDVEQVPRLAPGVPLVFTVTGSAGASAALAIEGLARAVPLREVEPGVYEATVTVRERDRLAADARVVAVLRDGDRAVRAPLREALVLGAAERADAADVAWSDRVAGLAAGADGTSSRVGRPVPADPSERRAPPTAVAAVERPIGVPVPTVRRGEPLDADTAGEVRLRPPPARARPVPSDTGVADGPPVATRAAWSRPAPCDACAVVESIQAVEGDDAPERAGAFASAVTGSVLGERFGEAHGRRVTKIWNVLSGRRPDAVAAPGWDVVLRAPDGRSVQRRYAERPPFDVGDTVRLAAGGVPAPRDPGDR